MFKSNTFTKILQRLINQKDIDQALQEFGYVDTARKFTVAELLKFWVTASAGSWRSFRDGEEHLKNQVDLVSVDHSTIAKKAAAVPFGVFKTLFHKLVSRCNREIRRKSNLPTFAIDSSTITAGKTRLSWAPFRAEKSGIKVHVRFDVDCLLPVQIEESNALEHDSNQLKRLSKGTTSIFIADRAYSTYREFDSLQSRNQFFVIRLKSNTVFQEANGLGVEEGEDHIAEDFYAYLGVGRAKTKNRFRVVQFFDSKNNLIQVATNIVVAEATTIAALYKSRWEVENFFRWLKQNLNVTSLFGTSPNAVFGQIFSTFIAYFLTQWLHIHCQRKKVGYRLSRTTLFRRIYQGTLESDLLIIINHLTEEFKAGLTTYPLTKLC